MSIQQSNCGIIFEVGIKTHWILLCSAAIQEPMSAEKLGLPLWELAYSKGWLAGTAVIYLTIICSFYLFCTNLYTQIFERHVIQIQSCIFFVLPCIAFPRNSSTAASLDNMLAGTSRGPRNISASQNPGGDSAQAWRTNRNNKGLSRCCVRVCVSNRNLEKFQVVNSSSIPTFKC